MRKLIAIMAVMVLSSSLGYSRSYTSWSQGGKFGGTLEVVGESTLTGAVSAPGGITGNVTGNVDSTSVTVTGLITKVPSANYDMEESTPIVLTHSIMKLTAAGGVITSDATPLISTTAYAQGTSVVLYNADAANAITIRDNANVDGNQISTLGTHNLVLAAGTGVEFVLVGDKWKQVGSAWSSDNLSLSGTLAVTGTTALTGKATLTAAPEVTALTASQAVFTDGSKVLESVAVTGTGNVVRAISPTLTGTAGLASLTASGNATVTGSILGNDIDSRTAATINVATVTATGVSISKSGANTTVNGTLEVTEAATFTSTAQATTMRLAVDLDPTSEPAAAGILGIDASFDVYVSTGTGAGAWVKIGTQS